MKLSKNQTNVIREREKIFNYSISTFNIKEFGVSNKRRASDSGRVDVTFFARTRSKMAFVDKLMKLKANRNLSRNWINERVSEGAGRMETIIAIGDNCIYVTKDQHNTCIGKYTADGKWVPFNPPLVLPLFEWEKRVF